MCCAAPSGQWYSKTFTTRTTPEILRAISAAISASSRVDNAHQIDIGSFGDDFNLVSVEVFRVQHRCPDLRGKQGIVGPAIKVALACELNSIDDLAGSGV